MKHEEMIEDLISLKEYFMAQSGGSFPMCLDYAIQELSKQGAPWEDEDDGK